MAVCLDGARDEVFYAAYDVTGAASIDTARVVIEPRVAPAAAAAHDLAQARGHLPLTLTGNGVDRFRPVFDAALPGAHVDTPMPVLAPAAARLAARRAPSATRPHALRPVYVRRPDAELARARQNQAAVVFEVHVRQPTSPRSRGCRGGRSAMPGARKPLARNSGTTAWPASTRSGTAPAPSWRTAPRGRFWMSCTSTAWPSTLDTGGRVWPAPCCARS